ncbi:DUF6691 family protein [Methylocella sp.]|uniref:DUF6691 family protein n=1 Tax=Methylocella sp. TaxID=1978226 RepID=UPI0037841EAF
MSGQHAPLGGLAAKSLASLFCGLLFGFGLSLSGLIDPARVRGFLDIFGAFDPTLAFVLGGAVIVSFLGVRAARTLPRPVLDDQFHTPGKGRIDARLIAGAAVFGVGWGMAGICPGPALAGLALGLPKFFVFVVALVAGVLLHDRVFAARRAAPPLRSGTAIDAPRDAVDA